MTTQSDDYTTTREPLAIVGMGCRLPGGVSGPESYWQMMVEGRSGIVPVPGERWNRERWYHENVDIPGKMITKWGGFIHDFDKFDAQFFGISPREALRMDPQQRWMLETAWESLEDAGIPPHRLRGTQTAVYVGIASNDYANVAQSDPRNVDVHTNSGSTLSIASNRISYLFDLEGPSVSVDTACSSALVAINLACESVWSGQATMALAGGVNALLTPDASIGFSKASMLSPSGQCFAFDDRADGYVRGEGAGMFVIKPVSEALRDGDRIYCTIRAAVINQDGNTSSMTVPGVESQADMLRGAYAGAGLEPGRVRYMEAHGTGTPVGDPIETRALGQVLAEGREDGDYCLLGSVKTNVGHLESGSGVAGLAKAALVLHHDTVPPNLNFETPNPDIPFEELKLRVATELQPLPHLDGHPAAVGVNSFGFGGTNSHIVLEAAPQADPAEGKISPISPESSTAERAERPVLLPLSGRGDAALRDNVKKWRRYLRATDSDLRSIAAAAGTKREHHDNRLALVAEDQADLLHEMTEWLASGEGEKAIAGKPGDEANPLVFVFTGQGAQWWAMGQQLLEREPLFRRTLEAIDEHLAPLGEWSLLEEMTRDEETSRIDRTNIAQPAIFALQVALAELWKSWGIVPAKVVGHSVGEVAAAYVAGAYTLEDAVAVIYHRSRLQDRTGGSGRMAAVGISPGEAKKALVGREERVHVAVINSPALVTLAGDTEPLEEIVATLEEEGKFVRWLRIDYAFHTHQMDPIEEELLEALAHIRPRATRIPYVSTVTGGVCDGAKLDAHYWWRNVRETVQFAPAITGLIRSGEDCFLEVGPHPALRNPIEACLSDQNRKGFYAASLRRKTDESVEMLSNLARLHHHGYEVDWCAVNQASDAGVRLPTYAWQREVYWLESVDGRYRRCAPLEHPLLGLAEVSPRPAWSFELDPRHFTWLDDHRFWGSVVFPASAYGEIGLAIARKLFPDEHYVVEDLEMKKALFVSEEKVPTVEVVFDSETRGFDVFSATGEKTEWELNAHGVLRKQPEPTGEPVDLEAIKARLPDHFTHEEYYEDYAEAGYEFRPLFQHLRNVWRREGESLAEIVAPEGLYDTIPDHHFHPAVLDACFHVVKGGQVIPEGAQATDYFYLPAAIRSIRLHVERPPLRLWGHARVNSDNDREYIIADIDVYDDAGNLVAEIYGFRADRVEQSDNDDLEKCLYRPRWEQVRLKGTREAGDARLPDPTEIVNAANEDLPELYAERGLADHYGVFLPALEEVARQFIVNAWFELGWDPKVGDEMTVGGLSRELCIADHHRKLVRGQLIALEEGGFVRSSGEDTWEVVEAPTREDALPFIDKLAREMPRFAAEADLQRLAGPNLAGVLCGETDPLEVLFPGGSSRIMERFYREAGDFPVINEQINRALEKAVENLPERRAIRILEVGAGTASLTSRILPLFPPDRTEYVFSDNGPLFLQAAQDRLEEEYPFVEYVLFDCEKDPAAQGIEPHHFDIVLASNVIHATEDLEATLSNLRRCLARNGLLLFLEVTWRRASLDNVFGLLPGWWRFDDTHRRADSALLPREGWEELLSELDFRDVNSFISSENPRENQQAVLVARAPEPVEPPPEAEEDIDAEPAADPCGIGEAGEEREFESPPVLVVTDDASGIGRSLVDVFGEETAEASVVEGTVEAIRRRLDELEGEDREIAAVVQSMALDDPRTDDLELEALDGAQDGGVRFARDLVEMLTTRPWAGSKPQVFFLTRGAVPVRSGDPLPGLASTPVTGLLRVANNEHPEFCWTQIDLDPAANEFEREDLSAELLHSDREHEVAFRGNGRFARRVHRVKSEELPTRTREAARPDGTVIPYRLQIDKPGILTNLSLNETSRRQPEADEIEVQVKAGGINFRDVMKALGIYPGNPVDLKWFGDDFAGTVVGVGANVTDLAPGDEVVGMAPYCFRSYVTVNRHMVFRKPEAISFVDAATLPTVFLTSHYAINELARMEKGESILVHAGTGGVGQAAIQIAKHLGLTIFSTAGTPEKRQLLADMGVDHALDSRSLEFADEILRLTDGEGVDAVLNSLAGDFIPKNFSVLRTFGRYMEIGKIDVYGNSKIGLQPLRNNISFHVIDLAQHLEQKPAYVARMFSELESMFQQGHYLPLPNEVFPVTEVVEAFRHMAAGKHIGKNVLDFDVADLEVGQPTESGLRFRGDGTYLITGGAGGFGLELAGWMADNGARHFALMSRSGPGEEALEKIERLRARGVGVADVRGDVTRREDIDRIVADIQEGGAPLIGVIHGAMVLDDEFINELDTERFDRVLRPKMLGAWNLHEATLDIPLEHFICFSSFSAVIGAVKQANYNAGNVFLDQLSHHRRALGLPSLTFNWGALEGAGFVARNEKTQQYLEMVGLGATTMEETLYLFGLGAPADIAQLGAARCDWQALARFSASIAGSNMFLPVVPRSSLGDGDSVGARILEAPAEKRPGMVEDLIAAQVAAVLGTDAARIDKDVPLTNLGLDSLMAIELVNRIEEKLGMTMPMGSVLNGPNITDLSVPVLEKLLESGGGAAGDGGGDTSELVAFEATGEMPETFPLSEGQKALWFLHRLAPESSAYNLVFSGKFRPLLDIEAMKRAFALLFERHPLIDVTFTTRDGEPVQVVQKGRTIDFREHDCTELDDEALERTISEHADRPFNLERGPVVRLELFRTADEAHVGLLSMHHIVSDAWSVAVMIQDLIEYYFSTKAGRTPQIAPNEASYADFVRWEKAHLESAAGEKMFEYWKDHLEGAPPAIDLPTDRPRPPVQTFNGGTLGFQLDEALTESVESLGRDQNVTLFTTLLSAYDILMHRYCRQEDIVVGVPLAGRRQPELRNSVGYYINPVPVRSTIEDDPTISEYLAANSERVAGALENQQYPLARLVDRLDVVRDPGRSPLFQVSFSMEKVPGVDEEGIAVFLIGQGGHTFHVGDLSMETIDLTTRNSQFEITLTLEEAGGQLFGCWHYNRDLFDEATISELCGLYEQVLREMTAHPEARLSGIDLLGDEEAKRVLVDSNETVADYDREAVLHRLVADVAAGRDEDTAVIFADTHVTYGELERLAHGVARDLLERGVKPGDNVGVLADRSPRMIAALLGVLQAGGTYVPLDPEFPARRLRSMLEDASPRALVASARLTDSLPEGPWKVLDLDTVEGTSNAPEVDDVAADSLAYIIYTSGSTGTPKGVEISHRAAVNFLTSMRDTPGLTEADRLLAVTTLSFDISLLELFLPLTTGATVVLAGAEDVRDGRRLANLLEEEDITVMQATPATWQLLLDSGWEGRSGLRIFCGGEALGRSLANALVHSADEVWNLYGPTETTVWSTVEQVEEGEDSIRIGRPIANTQVYVLDGDRRPVPRGFAGELWIGGDGLARGYHGRPDLTAEAFQEVELPSVGSRRLYRTGDLARWDRDGRLECLGRVDFQVKLRGVRIELGDIESRMESLEGIRRAVAIKRDDLPAGEGLVGYYVPEGIALDAGDIRRQLAEHLPASYLPAHFVALDELPTTPNGKTDRRRLPAPRVVAAAEGEPIAARNATEETLLAVFRRHFDSDTIGVTDDFFDMGGDSLLALRIIVEVSEALGRDVGVEAFLTHPTIERLAAHLDSDGASGAPAEAPVEEETPFALEDIAHISVEESSPDLPKLDAVALTYIPEALAGLSGMSRDEVPERLFGGKPRLTNTYDLEQGRIGVIMLPCYESDFHKSAAGIKAPTIVALEMAAEAGASHVALTGVIPSTTDHGRDIAGWIEGRDDLPAVTTGDATRSATIVKSVEGILDRSDRAIAGETVSVIGLGSIGFGTLRLMLEVLDHPARLILCDPYQTDDQMSRLRDRLRDAGFQGQIDLVKNGGALPPEVYEASLVVASSHLPGVLDVPSLLPGTLVVDYSFPPVFRTEEAVRRFTERGDILFTTGGELRMPDVVAETIFVPDEAEEVGEGVESAFLKFLAARDKHEITGCVLVSLLTGRSEEVEPTLGPLEIEDAVAHYEYLGEFGASPARLQMNGFFLPGEGVAAFRERGRDPSAAR